MADDGEQATKTDGGEAREERQENPGGAAGDGVAPVASDGGGDGAGRSREGSDGGEEEAAAVAAAAAQAPFTDLSQVDADWALARALQEQERAYMMLRLNNEGSDYGSWEGGSYILDEDDDFEDPDDETDDEDNDVEGSYDGTDMDDEDAFDVHAAEDANGGSNQAAELESENFSSDEAYARALQDAEEREMAARMLALAGLNDRVVEEEEDPHDRAFNIHNFVVDPAEDANGGSNQAAELKSENFSIGVSRMDRPNRDRSFNIHDFVVDDPEDANGGSNQAAELEESDTESDTFSIGDAEEREMEARMLALAGLNDRVVEEEEDPHDSQDTWEDVDPDELSYEELIALGDVVGIESRGLPADTIASLSSVSYKTGSSQNGTNDSCVICQFGCEDGEMLTVLSCKHSYHSVCINKWLQMNKVCPVCRAEVSGSANS